VVPNDDDDDNYGTLLCVCVCACANREEGVVSDIQEDTATELQYRFVVYQRVI